MAVREFPIEMVGVAYDCDECGAEMVRDVGAGILMTSPPKFPHRCPNGHTANLDVNYPTTGWRCVRVST